MTRATEAYTFAAIAIVSYIVLFLGFIPLPETVQDKIIPVVCLDSHEVYARFATNIYHSFLGGP